jgi:hypothetical protein
LISLKIIKIFTSFWNIFSIWKLYEWCYSKRRAFGFQLASLTKFYDMKSKDNKTTLLQYIIEFIMEEVDRKILNFMPFFELFNKKQITLI